MYDIRRKELEGDYHELLFSHVGHEVEILDVGIKKFRPWCRDDAVCKQLERGDVGCRCSCWSVVDDKVSSSCAAHTVRVFLLGPVACNDSKIRCAFALWQLVGVKAFDALRTGCAGEVAAIGEAVELLGSCGKPLDFLLVLD